MLVALGALVAGVVITGLPSKVPSDVVSEGLTTDHRQHPTSRAGRRDAATVPHDEHRIAGLLDARRDRSAADDDRVRRRAVGAAERPGNATSHRPRPRRSLTPASSIVVVANAGPADRLAARMAAAINALGYAQTVVTTARARRPVSEVYFAPGRDQEGLALASGIGLAATQVHPFPGPAVSVDDARADLWLIVGTDLVQRFEGGG